MPFEHRIIQISPGSSFQKRICFPLARVAGECAGWLLRPIMILDQRLRRFRYFLLQLPLLLLTHLPLLHLQLLLGAPVLLLHTWFDLLVHFDLLWLSRAVFLSLLQTLLVILFILHLILFIFSLFFVFLFPTYFLSSLCLPSRPLLFLFNSPLFHFLSLLILLLLTSLHLLHDYIMTYASSIFFKISDVQWSS